MTREPDHADGCPAPEELALLALDGASDASSGHLAHCLVCRDAVEALRRTDAALRAVLASPASSAHAPCPDPDLLAAFLDGSLSAEEAAGVETHVARCGACSGALDDAAGAAEPRENEARAAGRRALARFLPAAPRPAVPAPLRGRIAIALTAVAAGFLVTLLLLGILGTGGGPSAPATEADLAVDFESGVPGIPRVPHDPDPGPSLDPVAVETAPEPAGAPEPAPGTPASPAGPAAPPAETPATPPERPAAVERPPRTRPEEPAPPGVPARPEEPEPAVTQVPETKSWRAVVTGSLLLVQGSNNPRPLGEGAAVLESGAVIATPRAGLARVVLADSLELCLRDDTRVQLREDREGLRMRLESGECIASSSPEAVVLDFEGAEVRVEAHARVGATADGARRGLYVLEGRATWTGSEGAQTLDAGLALFADEHGTGKAMRFDPRRVARWADALRPAAVELLFEDFDGSPRGWKGKIEKRETFRHSPGALRAVPVKDPQLGAAVMKVNHKPLFAFTPNLVLRLALRVEGADRVEVRLWDAKEQKFHGSARVPARPGSWRTVTADLGRLFRDSLAPGTVVTGILVGVPGDDADLVVDDVAVVRIPGPPPVRVLGFTEKDLTPVCESPGRLTCETCRLARIIERIREIESRETLPGAEPPNPGGNGDGGGEDGGTGDEGSGGGNSEPPAPPAGGPPAPPPGAPPGPPPGPPHPPGAGPWPPMPGQPRPQGGPEEPRPEGEPGGDPQPPPAEGPATPPSAPAAASTPENLARVKRWLREHLPAQWPPHASWRSPCCESRTCGCAGLVKKTLQRYRLKENE